MTCSNPIRLAVIVVTLASAPGVAEASAILETVEQAINAGDYERARGLIEVGLRAELDRPTAERLVHLKAEIALATGDQAAAIDAFVWLLGRHPDYRPSAMESPKVQQVFREALERTSDPEPTVAETAEVIPPPPAANQESAVYERWWFWTAAAAVAAGSVTAAVLLRDRAPDVDYGYHVVP